jgi:hypothetical protein
MANTTTVLGPIMVHEKPKTSESSSAQIRAITAWDSRLSQTTDFVAYDRVREIRLDATVQLAQEAVLAPMIHTPWNYKSKDKAPKKAKQLIEDCLSEKRDWFLQNIIFNTLDFGWAPFEVIYDFNGTNIIITEFKQLLHDYTWILVYVETGRFAGFTNEPTLLGSHLNAVIIEEPYGINYNLRVEGTDWYGISKSQTLDPIVECWQDVEDTANRYDRKIAGATWVVYYPVGETPYNGTLTSNDEIANTLLTTLEASGAIAIPDEIQGWLDDSVERELKGKWRIELISVSGNVTENFVDRQKYLDNLKVRAFGIPERSILEGKFGTKAEAETHADIALATINTKHRLICDQINKNVIKPLLRFNYGENREDIVWIEPAPMVDAQFSTVKEIYRLIMQTPSLAELEIKNLDVPGLREQLNLPSVPNAPNDYEVVKEVFGQFGEEVGTGSI